jgi:acetolactate decarboxylase
MIFINKGIYSGTLTFMKPREMVIGLRICLLIILSGLFLQKTNCQARIKVNFAGAMMKIRQGDLSAAVLLDTLPQAHLFAIGPIENLQGELLVWDGKPFKAAMMPDRKQPFVEKAPANLKAIFLVYANVPAWDTVIIREPVPDMATLEKLVGQYAHRQGTDTSQAFPFLLFGKIAKGLGHIQMLDTAATKITPTVGDDAKVFLPIENQKAQFVGFYSHHHQRVFTHHDSYIHIHYRLYTKYHAGHLDEVAFDKGEPVRLLLPRK